MANKKGKTIGEMSKSRLEWQINPVTRITKNKKRYSRKSKHRKDLTCVKNYDNL